MTYDFENPFAGYGSIVYGDRFIGRTDDSSIVEKRSIYPKEAGNLAIVGVRHIGKSSLIYKTIMERKEELTTQNILPIWINIGTFDQIPNFFCSLVNSCLNEIENLNRMTEPIQRSADRVLVDKQSWDNRYSRIQRFFSKVRKEGYRVLFILDEFDHARRIFKDNISGFQKLRELSYNPKWRVAFIVIFRRSISEIEIQSQAISTFSETCRTHYLAMFSEGDINEYFKKLLSVGLSLSSDDNDRIAFYCGGHPHLLVMLGYEIVEMFLEEDEVDIDKATHRIEHSFIDHYDHLVELLQEDGNLNKLLQILFGPVINVKQTDVDTLLRYGLIKLGPNEVYVGFSEHFHNFLNIVQRDVDLWPLWSKTERALRYLITTKMINQYGKDWIAKLEKTHPKLKDMFDSCRRARQKEEKSFGSRASNNLIDFTNPADLFTIIFNEWNIFNPVFGKDKNYWELQNQLLAKIRNPLAHNRDEILEEYERQKVEGCCKEIMRLSDNPKNSPHIRALFHEFQDFSEKI